MSRKESRSARLPIRRIVGGGADVTSPTHSISGSPKRATTLPGVDRQILGIAALAVVAVYLLVVLGLVLAGRRHDAMAMSRFVPDCAVLFGRLARDPRVARRYKLMLFGVAAYLALPIDLVPDFIPIAGQLDDAIIVALALRAVLGGAGNELLAEHWPGPANSLVLVERLAGVRDAH